MIKIMFRAIDWRYIWYFVKWPMIIVLVWAIALGIVLFLAGCTPQYPFTPVPIPQPEAEFKDPLAIDHRQRESVAFLVDKYGDPEIPFSWSGDDFKVEVLRWKDPRSNNERWAIRINNIYRFTWTQFNVEKEKQREVKK